MFIFRIIMWEDIYIYIYLINQIVILLVSFCDKVTLNWQEELFLCVCVCVYLLCHLSLFMQAFSYSII